MKHITQSIALQTTWKYAGAVSIRVKVLGIVLGVIILLGVVVIIQMRAVLIQTLSYELEEQGIILANNIAQDANLHVSPADNYVALRAFLTERQIHYSTESHNTLVDYIAVENAEGEFISLAGSIHITSSVPSEHPHGKHPVFNVNHGATLEFHATIPDNK